HKKPSLTGSSAAIAKKIDAAFESTYSTWIAVARQQFNYNVELDGRCGRSPHFKVTTVGSIYASRYLSLAYTWTGDWYSASQDGVRTLTIDLKTGKSVKLSKFVSNKGKLFTWAACKALISKAPNSGGWTHDGQEDYCPDSEWQRSLDGWVVSKAGVQVYGSGDQGLYKATVPWAKLVKASYAKAKKTVTRKVPWGLRGCAKPTATVTVQGNLVTVRESWMTQKVTYYGVKSAGKKSGSTWRVALTNPRYGVDEDFRKYVHFKSKTSAKAVKYINWAFCE
ncbi:MAG: hypothetical protein VB036_16165, partial [Propionicimonas sp.]|nr:hypothetical protein [Propionicimonas sp.]